MDVVRVGLSLRALRIRRRWRQQDVADRLGVSRSVVARIERGGADTVTLKLLEREAETLGARLDVRVLWQGEALDRLLDSATRAPSRARRAIARRPWLADARGNLVQPRRRARIDRHPGVPSGHAIAARDRGQVRRPGSPGDTGDP